MLKKVELKSGVVAQMPIAQAQYPSPFEPTLEYSAAVRGGWNIAHTGMLVPESHEIFVCAQGCLRGVVLTAAEMGKINRFSNILIEESDVLEGDMEKLMIDGVGDILAKLPYTPKAVLVYTSCIHHFMACDLKFVYKTLAEKYPHIDFIDCYMTPTMRKSGLNPDQLMRRQIYALWKKQPLDDKRVNIVGNSLPTDHDSELFTILNNHGYSVTEIHDCADYAAYQDMAKAGLNLIYNNGALPGGDYLKETYGQDYLYLPVSYDSAEIAANYQLLAEKLGLTLPDFAPQKEQIAAKLAEAKAIIKDTPIMIDYTVSMRFLSLARLLLDHGFNVVRIYADSIAPEEEQDFYYLKEHYPTLELCSVVNFKMRFAPRSSQGKILAVGQKASYFTGSDNFVNTVDNSGFYGFSGVVKMLDLIIDAYNNPKEAIKLIQKKGWGCDLI